MTIKKSIVSCLVLLTIIFSNINHDIASGKSDSSILAVEKDMDYGVSIESNEKLKELVSGKVASSYDSEEHKLQTLVIKEDTPLSWLSSRKTRVNFPDWVKIIGVEIANNTTGIIDIEGIEGTLNSGDKVQLTDKSKNYVEFTSTIDKDKKAELHINFYVSIEAGKSGDITAEVYGKSLPNDAEVLLGKAITNKATTNKAITKNQENHSSKLKFSFPMKRILYIILFVAIFVIFLCFLYILIRY